MMNPELTDENPDIPEDWKTYLLRGSDGELLDRAVRSKYPPEEFDGQNFRGGAIIGFHRLLEIVLEYLRKADPLIVPPERMGLIYPIIPKDMKEFIEKGLWIACYDKKGEEPFGIVGKEEEKTP